MSLITTAVVSVLIYRLQRHHEKENEKLQEKIRKNELIRQVNLFLIQNADELDFLPMCVLASNLHRHKRHHRNIYTNFCCCSDELQNEILKMQNFTFSTIHGTEWVAKTFDELREDIAKYRLGKDILYGGVKYFHRGFENYRELEWTEELRYSDLFTPLIEQDASRVFLKRDQVCLGEYIVEYLDFQSSEHKEQYGTDDPIPPIDYMCEVSGFETAPENIVCAWVMQLVIETATVFRNYNGTQK